MCVCVCVCVCVCGWVLSWKSMEVIVRPGKVEGKIQKKIKQNMNKHFLFQLVFKSVLPCYFPLYIQQLSFIKGQLVLWVVYYLYPGLMLFYNFCDFTLLVICALLRVIHQGPCLEQVFFSFHVPLLQMCFHIFIVKIKQWLSHSGDWQTEIVRQWPVSTAWDYSELLN